MDLANGARVYLVFEGRDGIVKGGKIRAITECVSPGISPAVALPAPTGREETQMYMQLRVQSSSPQREQPDFRIPAFDRSGSSLRRAVFLPPARHHHESRRIHGNST
ncbi:polyphosphate kinase 2 family protein [Paraburkholderia phenoliruptrix]|uniref:hypothetical protein n=1 Tax=Paraburkholderia phenoliruptrix TaxID=252970 RepID=UPI0005A0F323